MVQKHYFVEKNNFFKTLLNDNIKLPIKLIICNSEITLYQEDCPNYRNLTSLNDYLHKLWFYCFGYGLFNDLYCFCNYSYVASQIGINKTGVICSDCIDEAKLDRKKYYKERNS